MMTKSLMACLVLGIILAMSFATFAAESEALTVRDASDESDTVDDTQMPDNVPTDNNDDDDADDMSLSFRGFGRFLSSKKKSPKSMTCDKYPKVCRAKGSKAKDCCKKKCVCMETDKQNCGKCGKTCKFGQACCKGKCINTMTDNKNCGGCNYKCAKGRKCRYGMCSYAYY
ncbi:unnamed protein product [Rhodiola kirilowii]